MFWFINFYFSCSLYATVPVLVLVLELDMVGVLETDDRNLSYFFNPRGDCCILLDLLSVADGLF